MKVVKTLVFSLLLCICCKSFVKAQNSQLVVLDIQKFEYSKNMDTALAKMIDNANFVIKQFKAENVVYIKSACRVLNLTLHGFHVDTLPPPDFDPRLHLVTDRVFIKSGGDAFTSKKMAHYLSGQSTTEIVLVGLLADECIYNTAIGALDNGYKVKIIEEAVVAETQKKKTKALEKLRKKGVKIVSINEYFKI